MRFLLLLFFTINSASAMYAKLSDIESGEKFTKFMKESDCGEACAKVPKDHNYNYSILVDEFIDDYSKPIFSNKKDVESCIGEEDCQEKLSLLDCKNKNSPFNISGEVFCAEIEGYELKLSGKKIFSIDQDKKDLHDVKKAEKEIEKEEREAKFLELREYDCTTITEPYLKLLCETGK